MFVAKDIITIELNYDYNSPLFGSMICNVLSTKQKLNKINTVTKINIILSSQASESMIQKQNQFFHNYNIKHNEFQTAAALNVAHVMSMTIIIGQRK